MTSGRRGRQPDAELAPHLVYLVRDDDGAVIYVGMTSRSWPERLAGHRNRASAFLEYMSEVNLISVSGYSTARAREIALIRKYRPRFNIADLPSQAAAERSEADDTTIDGGLEVPLDPILVSTERDDPEDQESASTPPPLALDETVTADPKELERELPRPEAREGFPVVLTGEAAIQEFIDCGVYGIEVVPPTVWPSIGSVRSVRRRRGQPVD
jgi:predicted GIY-YIG superfamily endonuclease